MTTLVTTRPWQLLRTALRRRADIPAPVIPAPRRRGPSMFATATPPPASLDLELDVRDATEGLRGL